MLYASPHYTHFVGIIIEQRTQGIPAQAHTWFQASIVYADHDAAQDARQQEQWREEEASK